MLLPCLSAVLLLLGPTVALYEEQAGFLDWHKESIGSVTKAQFAFRGRERAFVATDAAVIASLDTRDGSIVWRQVLEEEESIGALVLVPRPACVLTLSRQGRVLRAWGALDGVLLWEKAVSDVESVSKPVVSILPDVTGDGSSDILLAIGQKVQVLSAPKGKLVWTANLAGVVLGASEVAGSETSSIAVAVLEGGDVQISTLEASTGKEISKTPLGLEPLQTVLSNSLAVAISADGKLCALKYGASAHCQSLSSLNVKLEGLPRLGAFLTGSLIALHTADMTTVISLEPKPMRVSSYPGQAVSAQFEDKPEWGSLVSVTKDGQLQIKVLNALGGEVEVEMMIPASLLTFSGKPVQEVAWKREEGLAKARKALFLDLPAATAELEASYKALKPTLMDRMNAEVLTVKKNLGIAQAEDEATLNDINARLSSHLQPHKDSNGFRKLILILSESGKLFGLHSGDGRLLWSLVLDKDFPLTQLFLSTSSHDPNQAPHVLLLGTTSKQSTVLEVNAHTGGIKSVDYIDGKLEKVIQQPSLIRDNLADHHTFALIFGDMTVKTWPLSASLSSPLYFWKYDKYDGSFAGYKAEALGVKAVQQWNVAFAGVSDSVLYVAAKDPEEHVYSYAKVLGNRSMKLKYLNPNVIFVITGPSEAHFTPTAAEPSLTVQLLDTITGQIVYRQTLEGAKGPAQAVLSENWAVYSYYSTANQRFEIAVLEFYDVQARDLSIPSLLLGNQSSTLSAFAPTPIEVLHQAYFTPVGIKAMAVTATRRGITSKQLLLGTQANQVYLMDKRFVDPRRPRGIPTADEKLEMLPPYNDELAFTANLFASHKNSIEGLKEIVASPANLESTTLTLTYGLDLFFTRVQPSKTFDLLPDDFPFALLVMVTVILLIGAFVLKRMEDNSAVKRKWA